MDVNNYDINNMNYLLNSSFLIKFISYIYVISFIFFFYVIIIYKKNKKMIYILSI